jgi:hypothetical protein
MHMKAHSRTLLAVTCLVLTMMITSARSQTRTISYYDITKPAVWIENPGVQGDKAYTGFGQRFTLNSSSGYLDSIRIHFDSVSGDVLQVGVFRDYIGETSRGTFHLADYSFTGLLARTEIDLTDLDSLRDFWVTIPMEHLAVPKEFHIGVGANQITNGSDEFTSMFRLMGERHIGQEATLDSRSDILLTQNFADFTTDIFDGFFNFSGQSLGIDFHIDAVVDENTSSVKHISDLAFVVYPNPATTGSKLHVNGLDATSTIVLYNALGVEVTRWSAGEANAVLNLPDVPPGFYTIASGTSTAKLLIK